MSIGFGLNPKRCHWPTLSNYIKSFFDVVSYEVSSGSEITPRNKIEKTLGGLQIFGKRYDAHSNVAYIMTKL